MKQCRSGHLHDTDRFGFKFVTSNGYPEASTIRAIEHERLGPAFTDTQICVFQGVADYIQLAGICRRRLLQLLIEEFLREPIQAAKR